MSILLLPAALLVGAFLVPALATRRTLSQPTSSPALDREVVVAAEADPHLLVRTGLSPEHLSDPALASRLAALDPASAPVSFPSRPSRAEIRALEVVSDAAERTADRVYVGRAAQVRSGPAWVWSAPPLGRLGRASSALAAMFGAFSALRWADGDLQVLLPLLALTLFGLLLALVDVDTLLIDVPVLAVACLLVLLPLAVRAGATGSVSAFVAVVGAVLLLDALGGAVLVVLRARSGFLRMLPAVLSVLLVLVLLVVSPLLAVLASTGLLPAPTASALLPLAASSALVRLLVHRSAVRRLPSGALEVAPGPSAGVGAGDLLLLPLALGVPALLGGPLSALSAFVAATAVAAVFGLARRTAGDAGPMPFGPALLSGWAFVPFLDPALAAFAL